MRVHSIGLLLILGVLGTKRTAVSSGFHMRSCEEFAFCGNVSLTRPVAVAKRRELP